MEKIKIDSDNICFPMPCSLLGTIVNGKANFLTVSFLSMVSFKPPYIMAALRKNHYSNSGIRETGAFSINIPGTSMVEITDYCGIVSGKKSDKSILFNIFYGKDGNAPMIQDCPYTLECKLAEVIDFHGEELYIGEVIAAYSDNRYISDGVIDMTKIDPLILSMPQMVYFSLGSCIGKAWNMGRNLIKKD